MSKFAIIFPGMGYHCDKPLLYYGKKLAIEMGYQVIEIRYDGFEKVDTMQEATELALKQAEAILEKYVITADDEILCISKSIGTVVTSVWQQNMSIHAKNIFFTPVKETFLYAASASGIVFHGTKDPMADTQMVMAECEKRKLPLFLTTDGNHSLETGKVSENVNTLVTVIEQMQNYLGSL